MIRDRQQTRVATNILFALGTFTAFLLVFEGRLVIPFWLQPLGRMHPMVLHLPIVAVLVGMGLEFFRLGANDPQRGYDRLTTGVLFAAALLSGVTVIMGIFLAREEVYTNSQAVAWHKWTGVLVFALTSSVCVIRERAWYRPTMGRSVALFTVGVMIAAGHLGGALTHGEHFVFQPVMRISEATRPSFDDALIFDHVISPVLESKCVSCHNDEKRKGKLSLTGRAGIEHGGESGKLFLPGQPDSSLLLKRIHLPLGDKKHMPPKDKTQLTKDEMMLLRYWVQSETPFSGKLSALPASDTLRMVATNVFEAYDRNAREYDFPAVASATVEKLNSNYRVIRPVSKQSPALAVNLYNREVYSPAMLKDLVEVRQQVISLDVAKMPVTDEDLAYIARCENIQRLNLNFTDVSGNGLMRLRTLKNLSSLSLCGTSVGYEDLRRALPGFQSLQSVALWETKLSNDEMGYLQSEFPHLKITGASIEGENAIKLNAPRARNKIIVFRDSLELDLFHPINGVDIRYSIDGSEPDSIDSPALRETLTVGETLTIRARAFKQGWRSSDPVAIRVYRCSWPPDTAIMLSKMNRVHVAKGADTFFDKELGSFNANSPAWANNWAGFINNNMELLLRYDTSALVRSVSLNMLIETENFIFPAEGIEVWGGMEPDELSMIMRSGVRLPDVYRKPYIELFDFSFAPQEVRYLKIVARPVMKLPAWHKRKGKPALMLIDEILIN